MLGALVVAAASVVIALSGYAHDTDQANRQGAERAYVDFMDTTKRFEFALRYEPLRAQGATPTIDEITRKQAMVDLYGSDEARKAASDAVSALGSAVSQTGPKATPGWRAYDAAMTRFQRAIRADLGVT
ncbi:hypothetical protein [Luteipulveratus halotolerans]|uniref:hypothetical protein n=1 Tax=Luteipulveratus halotolerans TaxID=1631356 RepID=UPI0012F8CB95|nr:hypothetical protein [Luteipulveratus halotolerans]